MKSRTFLVTGASKGIGRAVAARLNADGHRVVGLARQADDPGFPGTLVSVDLSDRVKTQAVLDRLVAEYKFDGLVNNVGLVKPQRLGAIDLDTLDSVMSLNLHPAIQAAQALLPNMSN